MQPQILQTCEEFTNFNTWQDERYFILFKLLNEELSYNIYSSYPSVPSPWYTTCSSYFCPEIISLSHVLHQLQTLYWHVLLNHTYESYAKTVFVHQGEAKSQFWKFFKAQVKPKLQPQAYCQAQLIFYPSPNPSCLSLALFYISSTPPPHPTFFLNLIHVDQNLSSEQNFLDLCLFLVHNFFATKSFLVSFYFWS